MTLPPMAIFAFFFFLAGCATFGAGAGAGGRVEQAAAAAGFQECYNVAGGFEGDPNDQGHRGTVNGWKVDGLPWRQR